MGPHQVGSFGTLDDDVGMLCVPIDILHKCIAAVKACMHCAHVHPLGSECLVTVSCCCSKCAHLQVLQKLFQKLCPKQPGSTAAEPDQCQGSFSHTHMGLATYMWQQQLGVDIVEM